MVRLLFPDHSTAEGASATDALATLCGGWNPPDVASLKRALAKRCQVLTGAKVNPLLDDETFIARLDSHGFLTVQDDRTE